MRDELIMKGRDIVNNLVRKYNNHKLDEDLVSVGVLAVVECVDKCIQDGLTDSSQILARCNIWVRNALLHDIYKQRAKLLEDTTVIDNLVSEEDTTDTMGDLQKVLSDREKAILAELLRDVSDEEIMAKFSIKMRMLYHYKEKIKQKIKNLYCNFEGV